MKKPKIKALKQLAGQLPYSVTLDINVTLVKGSELSQQQCDSVKGSVDLEAIYETRNYKVVEIDHFSRLKKAFGRRKEQGIADYILWLDANNRKMNELFENFKLQQVDKELKDIAEKGGAGFWSNLIKFLLAFITVFLPKKRNA